MAQAAIEQASSLEEIKRLQEQLKVRQSNVLTLLLTLIRLGMYQWTNKTSGFPGGELVGGHYGVSEPLVQSMFLPVL